MSSFNYNKQAKAIQQIEDIFHQGKVWKLSSSEISQKLEDVVFSKTLLKAPRYARSYCRGYVDCMRQQMWMYVEFCYIIDGVQYSTYKASIFPRVPAESMKGNVCAHYYIGTDKHFTDPRVCD